MLSRILSTIVLWTVILGSLWLFGAHAAVALATILAVLTLHEFYRLTAKMGAKPFHVMGLVFASLMIAGPYYLAYFTDEPDVAGGLAISLLVLAMVVSCIRVLGERNTANRVESIAATVGGLFYIPYLLHFLVRILMREADSGENLAICLWVIRRLQVLRRGALLTGLAIANTRWPPRSARKRPGRVPSAACSSPPASAPASPFSSPSAYPVSLTPAVGALVALPLAVITIVSDLIESAVSAAPTPRTPATSSPDRRRLRPDRQPAADRTGRVFHLPVPGVTGWFDPVDFMATKRHKTPTAGEASQGLSRGAENLRQPGKPFCDFLRQ